MMKTTIATSKWELLMDSLTQCTRHSYWAGRRSLSTLEAPAWQFTCNTAEYFKPIWTTGNFPPAWQQAIGISLPKPGKDHSDLNNYHCPIALNQLPVQDNGKNGQQLIGSAHLEANNLITNIQSGFWKEAQYYGSTGSVRDVGGEREWLTDNT